MKEIILILDNLRSVQNVASIFRTAECAGVKKIFLCGVTPAPTDSYSRIRKDFAKISLGSENNIEWKHFENVLDTFSFLSGHTFVSLESKEGAEDYYEYVLKDKTALFLGNEVDGVSDEVLKRSDSVIEIPMHGKKESLNVSVALGISLFKLIRS